MPRNFLLTWSAVGALIFLLIIILPFIARILWQNIQKLLTELHLIIKKKKKWGDARSQREECRLGQRSCGGRLGIRKGVIKPQETPVPEYLPQNQSTLRGALPHNHFFQRRS